MSVHSDFGKCLAVSAHACVCEGKLEKMELLTDSS